MLNYISFDIFIIGIIIKIIVDMYKIQQNKYSFKYTKYVDLVMMCAIVALLANIAEMISHMTGNTTVMIGTHACNIALVIASLVHWSAVFSRRG